jgi:hypothetical protein
VGQIFILLSPAPISGATASPTWSTVSSDPPMRLRKSMPAAMMADLKYASAS